MSILDNCINYWETPSIETEEEIAREKAKKKAKKLKKKAKAILNNLD